MPIVGKRDWRALGEVIASGAIPPPPRKYNDLQRVHFFRF